MWISRCTCGYKPGVGLPCVPVAGTVQWEGTVRLQHTGLRGWVAEVGCLPIQYSPDYLRVMNLSIPISGEERDL